MQRHFDKGMVAVLVLLVVVIAANALIAYRNIIELYEARVRVGQSRQVQATLKDLLSSVREAETGLRGYVITADEAYLAPYSHAIAALGPMVERVDAMTRSSPSQQGRLHTLRQRIDDRVSELNRTLGAYRQGGFIAARDVMHTDRGKTTMEALRTEVDAMVAEETRVLEARNQLSLQSMDVAHGSSAFAAIMGLLILGFLVSQMRRNLLARDRATAVLNSQRELFRGTLASLAEAVVTTDEHGRITYMNSAAEALTRRAARDAIGQPVGDVVRVVDERLRLPVENSAQKALRDGEPVPFAHRFFLAGEGDEPQLPVDDSATLIRNAEGRVSGAVLVFRDITQRKRSQDALLQADRRKDEFLAVLAHELRNPLAPLRNALHIGRLANNDPATLKQLWAMMERQIQQMVRLIDDLLDVSRISRNKLELRREPVDIAGIVDAALEMSAPLLERFRHKVEVSIAPGVHVVDGDRARLIQVLDNLLSNAAKYTPEEGLIELAVTAEREIVRIRVKDSGIGIPPEMLDRVFEMFTQVDRSLERSRGGLGIGLTLVRRLVELHGGSVAAHSAGTNQGSEFVITLPRAAAAVPLEQAAIAPGSSAGRPLRILVVDDNEDAAETLTKSLEIMGHEVKTAYDGTECLKLAESFKPHVVFLDIGMPRLNGYDTARRLRSDSATRNATLVAVTGWGQDEDRRRAREAGFDHHLVKPVDFAWVANIIETHSASRRAAGSLEEMPNGTA
jgi:PAS domain S-box-containing protein